MQVLNAYLTGTRPWDRLVRSLPQRSVVVRSGAQQLYYVNPPFILAIGNAGLSKAFKSPNLPSSP